MVHGVLDQAYDEALRQHPRDELLRVDASGRVDGATGGAQALLKNGQPVLGRLLDEVLVIGSRPPEGSVLERLRAGRGWASAFDPTVPGRGAVWVARPVITEGAFVGAVVIVSAAHIDPPAIDSGPLTWAAFEVAQEALVVIDANRRVVLVNEVFRSASTRAKGRALSVGDDLLVSAAPGTEADVVEALAAARAGQVVSRRRRVRFANGEEFLHSVQYRKLDDAGHIVMGAVTVPLTSEPMASLVARTLDLGPVSLIISDATAPDYPIVYASANLERLTGHRPADVLGKNPRLFQGPNSSQPALDIVRRALATGGSCDVVLENVRADQTRFVNRLNLFPLRDDFGVVTHYAAFQQDVTELHDLRLTLQRNALGQTTVGLVSTALHDLRNVLTVAMAGASLAAEDAPAGDTAQALGDVVDALRRAGEMTRLLLQPLHLPSAAIGQANVARLFETVRRVGQYLMPGAVTLHVDTAAAGTVIGDEGSLERVLVNLVLNARDAMGSGGGQVWLSALVPSPGRLTLVVRDDGPGLPEQVRRQLFEAYVTTKGEGRGTGLGLASCKRLVEAAGGALRFETGPQGTTWFVELQQPGVDAAEQATARQRRRRLDGEQLVLVSPDQALRATLSSVLRRRGAEVQSVGVLDDDAVRRPDSRLLILDGAAVQVSEVRRYLEVHAARRVLVLGDAEFGKEKAIRYLPKPFDGEALVGRVAELLAAADGA